MGRSIGIVIHPEETKLFGEFSRCNFRFTVGRIHGLHDRFIPLRDFPHLKQKLERLHAEKGEFEIGSAKLSHNAKVKVFSWEHFTPFENLPIYRGLSGLHWKLHHEVAKHLLKGHNGYMIWEANYPSDFSEDNLKRAGLPRGDGFDLTHYVHQLGKTVNRVVRKRN
ncbi:MAG: hypothetical protein V1722_04700 [Candidatus Micrarchaeota archaeon]